MGGAAVQYQGSPQAMARSKSRRNNSRGSVSKREVGYLVAQIHGGKVGYLVDKVRCTLPCMPLL